MSSICVRTQISNKLRHDKSGHDMIRDLCMGAFERILNSVSALVMPVQKGNATEHASIDRIVAFTYTVLLFDWLYLYQKSFVIHLEKMACILSLHI